MNKSDYYKLLIQGIELQSVSLTSANSVRNVTLLEIPEVSKAKINVKPNFTMEEMHSSDVFIGKSVVTVSVHGIIKHKRRKLARFVLTHDLIYEIQPKVLEQLRDAEGGVLSEVLEQFARSNVGVNVWPYARAELAHISSVMGLPVITLQVMRRV